MSTESVTLGASQAREALFAALGPVWRATLAGCAAASPAIDPDAVLLVCQLRPLCVNVVQRAQDDRKARALVIVKPEGLTDGGDALREALLAVLGGTLSGLDQDAAGRALLYSNAVAGRGGFVVICDPADGSAAVQLAREGEDLSESINLGGLGEGPCTAH